MFTSYRCSGVSSEISEEGDDDIHEALPTFFPRRQRTSEPSLVGSPEIITTDMIKHLNRVHFQSESESDASIDSDADTIGEVRV